MITLDGLRNLSYSRAGNISFGSDFSVKWIKCLRLIILQEASTNANTKHIHLKGCKQLRIKLTQNRAMSFLDSTKAFSCESFHWKGISLWVNSLKALTTTLKFGQNLARKFSIHHTQNCFYHDWGWADPFRAELESRKKHFWGFKTQLGWVLLEFHLLHSQQEIMKILIVIFLRLFLWYSTSTCKNTISNVAETF